MSLYLDQNSIEAVKSWVFAESLNLGSNFNSTTGKAWQANIPSLQFEPDFAIVRSVSYSNTISNNTALDSNCYVISSNLSGGIDYMGSFIPAGTPFNIGAGILGMAGSISCPQILIKVAKPLNNVSFQIQLPSTTADDTLVNANSTNQALLTGQLLIHVDFIKLKKK